MSPSPRSAFPSGRVGWAVVILVVGLLQGCLGVPIPTARSRVERTTATVVTAAGAALMAGALAPRLRELIRDLRSRDEPGTEIVPLIDEGEARALDALAAAMAEAGLEGGGGALRPVPLEDFIRLAADRARAEARRASGGAAGTGRMAAAVVAILPRIRLARSDDRGALAGFLAALTRLLDRAEASDLQTTLCVTSRPKGGSFEIFPASASTNVRSARAVGTLTYLWRGIYRYRVKLGGEALAPSDIYLDLLQPDRLTLDCRLGGGEVRCAEQPGLARGCPT